MVRRRAGDTPVTRGLRRRTGSDRPAPRLAGIPLPRGTPRRNGA
ncbi:hypothetical protein T261_7194 [Streptomyces lydicus]|nr:hypothetical protein T261_7194 [Streptomyces lydicus]